MSFVESYAEAAPPAPRPWWKALPTQLTPVSDGAPEASHLGTERSSVPAPCPSWQSTTTASVRSPVGDLLSRRWHGSGVPRGLSSLKFAGVPLSSKAPRMFRAIMALPPAHVRRSLG